MPVATALCALASAQTPDPWLPSGNPDPLRSASLPVEAAEAVIPAPGRWEVRLSMGTFNLWDACPEVVTVRRELGLHRQSVSAAELRELERLYPGRDIWLLDVEGWRTDLFVSHSLGARAALNLHVPWIDIGRPHQDGLAEGWHRLTGLPNAARDLFSRDETLVYLHGRRGTIERRDLGGWGVGDVAAALALAVGTRARAEHRLVLVAQAPTGRRDGLRGSGGWDFGARWFSAWYGPRTSWLAGIGYTRLDPEGDLLGVRRADLWHLAGSVFFHLWRQLEASYRVTLESSPLACFTAGAPGDPALFMRFGLAAALARSGWLALEMGQNWPGAGIAPDFSFHLTVGLQPTGS
jgi:hypothetical protein